jgi:hypothetical protein
MPTACDAVVAADATVVPSADAATNTVVGGDAIAPDATDGGTVPCAAPEPPQGVPSAAEAEAKTKDLLAAIGEDPAGYELETFADEWSASVVAWPSLDGVRAPVSWGFGFGADGVVQSANGSLADPVPAGPYPLIDLDAALAWLTEHSSLVGTARGGPHVDVAEPTGAAAAGSAGSTGASAGSPTATGAITVETVVPEPTGPTGLDWRCRRATDQRRSAGTRGRSGRGHGTRGRHPDRRPPRPLVGVGCRRLGLALPAYTFIDTTDRQHTVPAVTDEFLIVVDTPAIEPDRPTTPTSTGTKPLDPPTVDHALITGLTVDEAANALAEVGLTLRVVLEGDVDLAVTDDFSATRVNVTVNSGTVTAVVSVG